IDFQNGLVAASTPAQLHSAFAAGRTASALATTAHTPAQRHSRAGSGSATPSNFNLLTPGKKTKRTAFQPALSHISSREGSISGKHTRHMLERCRWHQEFCGADVFSLFDLMQVP